MITANRNSVTAYAIVTFHNTHFALKAKKLLQRNGKRIETIPVPRELSSECGFCCKVLWDEIEEIERIFRDNNVEIDSVYRWERDEEKERKKAFRFV